MSQKPMTVAELIAKLQKMPQDAEVSTEGCDCSGDVGSVTLETNTLTEPPSQYVYLNRTRSY